MKKMMQIILMIMIVVCGCSSSYTVNAALSDEEFQMLVELARDGDMLSNMLTENARHTLDGSDPMYHEWAVAKGYVVPSETEKVYIS